MVREAAGETFGDDIAAVEAALDDLQAVADEVAAGTPVTEVQPQLDQATGDLQSAAQGLGETAQSQDCDVRG